MEHKNYFPEDIKGQRAWLVNYRDQIATDGGTLGLTPNQISDEQASCKAMILDIDQTDALLTAATARVAKRDLLISTSMGVLKPQIQIMKKNPAYTEDLGKGLKLIGSEIVVDKLTVQTEMKLVSTPLGVDIKFGLKHCQAGNIYCKRGNETSFTFLKSVIHPHTIDTRPSINPSAPEKREYYVLLLINDTEVGIASLTQSINY